MRNLSELSQKEIKIVYGGLGAVQVPIGYTRRTLLICMFSSAIAGYIIIPRIVGMAFVLARKALTNNTDSNKTSDGN